jgi:thiamine-phosphate diphosphorylase
LREPRLPPRLVAITPGTLADVELVARVRAAVDGGLRALVVREPQLADAPFLALAEALRAEVDRRGPGWLCVHDRPHLAAACRADAVHLGWRSLRPDEIAWLDRAVARGVSTHAGDDRSRWERADYLFHGPVRETRKAHALAPIGFDGLAQACAATRVPIWALGGMKPEHAAQAAASGARGMAVLSGLIPARDPAASAAAYSAAVDAAWLARG